MIKPTVQEVDDLIRVLKHLLRNTDWTPRISKKKPTRWIFESACSVGTSATSNVIFRAEYRPAASLLKGLAVIEFKELIYVSLFIGSHRICAIDCHPGQKHTNKVGFGRPFYKEAISSPVHMHLWVEEGDGYAEPLEMQPAGIEAIFFEFFKRVNLVLKGEFAHPLKGQQLEITGSWTAFN